MTDTGAPRIGRYRWSGGEEQLLRWEPEDGPIVIAAPALLEEGNRTRAMLVDVLRRLAAAGIGAVLPDLPGTGESLIATDRARLADWQAAFAACAASLPAPVYVVAVRGGVLIDGEAAVAGRWRLSPLSGEEQVREWSRLQSAGGRTTTGDETAEIAGNEVATLLLAEFDMARLATQAPCRTVRLESDPRPADRHLSGRPLWRASEPDVDPALQQAIAGDIQAWITTCAG